MERMAPGCRREAMPVADAPCPPARFACGDHGRGKLALLIPLNIDTWKYLIYFHVSEIKQEAIQSEPFALILQV